MSRSAAATAPCFFFFFFFLLFCFLARLLVYLFPPSLFPLPAPSACTHHPIMPLLRTTTSSFMCPITSQSQLKYREL